MKILVIDIGGTHIKCATRENPEVKFASGPAMTAPQMVEGVLEITKGWDYDAVSMGYPAPVVHGKPAQDPVNLGPGWTDYDFAQHFGKPVKITNDAAMQAMGSYEGGRMLFLGLGTGLGSALIIDGVLAPLELAHLPYRKGHTFEDYVGLRGLAKLGKKHWRKAVFDVTTRLKAAMVADYVVIGGGNVRKLQTMPPGAKRGDNTKAIEGGFRLWEGLPKKPDRASG